MIAAPLALRAAVGVRSRLGAVLDPLTVRALMIHRAEDHRQPKSEVGWGHFETDIGALTTCDDHEAIVLFQGELPVGTHMRAPVPLPDDGPLAGMVTLSATLVIAPETDPEHPGAYTRSGLEVVFRPNATHTRRRPDGSLSLHAESKSFFSQSAMYAGAEFAMREGGHKWEPCLRQSRRFQANSLRESCFDIYYHHREGGSAPETQLPIRYALIVGITAPKVTDLYSRVVRSYANVLARIMRDLSGRRGFGSRKHGSQAS